ncbi:hypothetical protein Ancab_000389 [Ancistrocladus abbreviatus]
MRTAFLTCLVLVMFDISLKSDCIYVYTEESGKSAEPEDQAMEALVVVTEELMNRYDQKKIDGTPGEVTRRKKCVSGVEAEVNRILKSQTVVCI